MSYISVADAETYFANRIGADAWDIATNTRKTKALEHGTSIIDHLPIAGSKTVSSQTNQFPRSPDLTVPSDVKYACAEIALALLSGIDPELEYRNAFINRMSHGELNVDQGLCPEHVAAGVPSITAWRLLRPYLIDETGIGLVRVQ